MINQNLYLVKGKISRDWKLQRSNKNSVEEDWVEGCLVIANDRPRIYQYRIQLLKHCLYPFPVEPETICRSIGLKDSYEKLIYEKDIVEFESYGDTDRYLIWWNQEMSMMTAIPLKELEFNGHDYYCNRPNFTYDEFCFMMQDPWGDFEKVKIIGNIIDKPELINVEHNLENTSNEER